MSTMFSVNAERIELIWPRIQHFVQEVIKAHPAGSYTEHGILAAFARGTWICWIACDGDSPEDPIIAIAGSALYPDLMGRNIFRILFCAGVDWLTWIDHMDYFEQQCLENGVFQLECLGRDGFRKKFKEKGYDTQYVVYRKVLSKPNTDQVGNA